MEEGRELFSYVLLLNCLRFKIILMSKQHSLGWHILFGDVCLEPLSEIWQTLVQIPLLVGKLLNTYEFQFM